MSMTRKTITITEKQASWVKAQFESGDYGNDSEYFRDLVRRDLEATAKFQALKAAIQEGLGSGMSNRSLDDIIKGVEARLKADGRL